MCSIFSKAAINVSYQNESNVAIYIFKGKNSKHVAYCLCFS